MPCHVPRVTARVTEHGRDGLLGGVLQRREVVETGAGDDAEGERVMHRTLPARPRSWPRGRCPAAVAGCPHGARVAIAATGPVSLARPGARSPSPGQRGRHRRRRGPGGDEHRAGDRLAGGRGLRVGLAGRRGAGRHRRQRRDARPRPAGRPLRGGRRGGRHRVRGRRPLDAGHGSVATPGAVTACELAVEELGPLPWADVVAPSAGPAGRLPDRGAAARYLSFTAHPSFGPTRRRCGSSPGPTARRWRPVTWRRTTPGRRARPRRREGPRC